MAQGQVYRGGIDVGVGAEIEPGEIYGSALSRAVELESQVAQYPRIVIGDELMTYLIETTHLPGSDNTTRYIKGMAGKCLDLITADVDGRPILHYLGEGHRRQMGEELRRDMSTHLLPAVYGF